MVRGPAALFGAIVAVGLGPAMWLGVRLGAVEVTPVSPPSVVGEHTSGPEQLTGGTGAGESELGNDPTVAATPRAKILPLTSSPSPRPSTVHPTTSPSPTATTVSPSASPTPTPTETETTPPTESTTGPTTPPTESTTEPTSAPPDGGPGDGDPPTDPANDLVDDKGGVAAGGPIGG